MIVRENKLVAKVYRGDRGIKQIYRGDRLVWQAQDAYYLEVEPKLLWITPQEIEWLLIHSNVNWNIQ